MIEALRAHLAQTDLIPAGSRVLVGYSGGADSTCLLTLLHELGVEVVAAHLHHGQRDEADGEQVRCAAYAESMGIEFATGRADVPLIARQMGIGLEEAGREARESFFRQARHGVSADLVATAHTRSDRAETILLNLVRGAGLAGLGGIPAERDGIVRPLMEFSREETRGFCEGRGLWFHDDPANGDPAFSRARIRHRVMPELRALNPAVDVALCRLGDLAREEDHFLDAAAAAGLERAERPPNGPLAFLTADEELRFDRATLLHLPPVLARRALRLVARTLGAGLDHAQSALAGEGLRLGRGSVTAEGGEVVLEFREDRVDGRRLGTVDEPFRHPLTVPGETEADAYGWSLAVYPAAAGVETPVVGFTAGLRSAANLYLRSARAEDRIHRAGEAESRDLASLMAGAGLTAAARRRLPIVCDVAGPIWAPGVALAGRAAGEGWLIWFGPSKDAPRP